MAFATLQCDGSTSPDSHRDFLVDVNGETFVMRTTDPETMQQAVAVLNGTESFFPVGPLRSGDGGFNAPWSWHMDADDVRLTEVAVEVCDGLPSYVEEHVEDFLGVGYCPWSGRIVRELTGAR